MRLPDFPPDVLTAVQHKAMGWRSPPSASSGCTSLALVHQGNGQKLGYQRPVFAVNLVKLHVHRKQHRFLPGVVCCASPEECLQIAKDDATYVVQKHIPDPLLYYNGEKCHIKCLECKTPNCCSHQCLAAPFSFKPRFYNLLVGLDDGVTWRLYTYKDGYLSISPKAWSPTDLSATQEQVISCSH